MTSQPTQAVTLFLCGDVMLGRGVDQVLGTPGDPTLRESYLRDARDYVRLGERENGPIPRKVPPAYPWGAALEVLARARPAARLINLETSITTSDRFWPDKGIHYRMHPANVGCLSAAEIDACALANNHVLDFGREGLAETLAVLRAAGLQTCGAGARLVEAQAPARIPLPGGGTLWFFSFGTETSGVEPEWAAGNDRSGVDFLPDLSAETSARIAERVRALKRPADLAVASIHWGSNWGYDVRPEQVDFAHRLIDGGVDLIHGHSSHHPRPIEVYRGKLVLYGCGDFINDYEGIRGYEEFHGDLRVMYLPALRPDTGALHELQLVLLRAFRFTLVPASHEERVWLSATLSSVSRRFGVRVEHPAPESAHTEGVQVRWTEAHGEPPGSPGGPLQPPY